MRPRDNPFRVECLETISYRFLNGNLETTLKTLAARRYRGAIVGPHGHGKSTLLALLASTLSDRGYSTRSLQITESNRTQQTKLIRDWLINAKQSAVLFLDGAEQLSYWNWLQVRLRSRRFKGLIVTAHKPGLLPTVFDCQTSVSLLNELVEELKGRPLIGESISIQSLYEIHGGNLRECLRALYDHAAEK